MRLFFGIPLPTALIEELLSVSIRLRTSDAGLRWSAPESWHITLQFLGNVTEEQHACVVSRAHELRFRPLSIRLEGLGFFDRSGVFFATVAITPELLSLQQQVAAATAPCGLAAESRPYHPHITLARSKGRNGNKSLLKLKSSIRVQPRFKSFSAEEFVLYESILKPGGSQYIVRDHFPAGR